MTEMDVARLCSDLREWAVTNAADKSGLLHTGFINAVDAITQALLKAGDLPAYDCRRLQAAARAERIER